VGEEDRTGVVGGREQAPEVVFSLGVERTPGGVEAGALEFRVTDPKVVGNPGIRGGSDGEEGHVEK
jgi:hypothetical protein